MPNKTLQEAGSCPRFCGISICGLCGLLSGHPESGAFIGILRGLGFEVDTETFDHALTDTLQLARTYKLSAYDASYLEIALRYAIPLATLDEALQKADRKAGVESV